MNEISARQDSFTSNQNAG